MKKVLAFALSLVLILGATLPGTLAVSIDADTTANEMTLCTCGTEDGTHAEDCPQFQSTNDVPTPAQEGEEGNQPSEEDVTPAEGDGNQPSAPEDEENGTNDGENADPSKEEEGETPDENAGETAGEGGEVKTECTCGAEGDTHAAECPLYNNDDEENTDEEDELAEEPEEEPEEEVITDTVVTVTNGVPDFAPPFSTAGPLIKYDTPALVSSISTFSTFAITTTTPDIDDAGGTLTSGLELNKTATANDDGTFTITLEAYATGESVTTYVKDGVDIVLMLDLSNYMGAAKTETTIEYTYTKVAASSGMGGEGKLKYWNLNTNTQYYYKPNNSNVYYAVTVSVSGNDNNKMYSVKYNNGSSELTLASNKDDRDDVNFTLYTRTENPTTTTTYDTSDPTKLNALKTAVNNFIDKVQQQTPASRIAIVTYAGSAEVKSGTQTATVGALVEVTDAGVAALHNIVNNLSIVGGASNSHYAAADAVKIFQAVPTNSSEYSRQRVAILFSAGIPGTGWATENKTVLTTGNSIAQATMTQAYILKSEKGTTVTAPGGNVHGGAQWSGFAGTDIYSNTVYTGCGATVYCVGLDITTSGNPADVDMNNEPYQSGALANEYFWRTSSHRLNGTHILNGYTTSQYEDAVRAAFGEAGVTVYRGRKSGTTYGSLYFFYPDSLTRNQSNGYYLTTTSGSDEDLAKLDTIFNGIAGQIVTEGSSSTTLGTSTVIRDIMSPQFALPEGTTASNISVKEYKFTGKNGNEYTFSSTAEGTTSATATVESGTVSVTGFDFSANWCGTSDNQGNVTYHGSKLVISFKVTPKDGFLGGNNVYTNDPASGVYKDASQESPLDIFPQPQANVQIKDNIVQTPGTMNVYLLGNVSAADIRNGCKVKCGDVTLNLNPDVTNYGLEDWQTEYVNISVIIKDASGNELADFNNLEDDTTYSITVTVSPKEEAKSTSVGEKATAKSNTETGKINVFTPELTFKDSDVYYGDTAPSDYTANKTNEVWKHGETLSTDVTVIGDAPTLDLSYTPDETKIKDNKINSKQDIPVDVTVKIGTTDVTENTTFQHTDCTDRTETLPEGKEFLLHVKTCSLTITKAAGENTTIGNDEYFVFNVMKDGVAYTQVTIQGTGSVEIKELPVGSYTVEEDASTAWRYSEKNITGNGTLSSGNPEGIITCTNGNKDNKWLNHFNRVTNVFGSANPNPDYTNN